MSGVGIPVLDGVGKCGMGKRLVVVTERVRYSDVNESIRRRLHDEECETHFKFL